MNYKLILKLPLLALAFTPLIVTNSTLFPFIFGKTTFIRAMVSVFWVLFAVYLFYPRKSTVRINQLKSVLISVSKNPLFIFTSLFILSMLLSTVFAVNSYRAFFGDIERGEGYLGILYFFGFFTASLLVFEKRDWLIFFKLSLLVGVILFFHGLYQYGDFARMQTIQFTQAMWLGIAILMLIPILMVPLSLALPQPVNRWANIVVAVFFFLFNLVGLPTYPSAYDKFLLAVSLGFNVMTVWTAKNWT